VTARLPSVRTVVAIAGLLSLAGVFASLGAWQLRRAAETRALGAQFAAAQDAPVLERAPDELSDELRFRRLRAHGSYAPKHQFLLDNRVRDGVAGYEVLTPLKLADDSRWVLVNRGWVAAGPDRRVLPEVAVDAGVRAVSGRVERLPRPGIRLGAAGAATAAPGGVAVVVYPTVRELGALLGEPLLDYELLLDDAAADGFARDWRAPGLAIERHLAYAGQWFLLALGAFGASVAIAVKASTRRLKPRAAESGS
jgi:surfeit locus 1 family protein